MRHEAADQVVFSELTSSDAALWGLLLCAGYLRADGAEVIDGRTYCDLTLTNREALVTFEDMVRCWWAEAGPRRGLRRRGDGRRPWHARRTCGRRASSGRVLPRWPHRQPGMA